MSTFDEALAVFREYEELMRAAGSPLPDLLAPPHPDPAGAFAPFFPGLTLPDELIAWWSWHDGPSTSAPASALMGLAHIPLSVETVIAGTLICRRSAEIAAEPPEMPAEDFWSPTWLPALYSQDVYLAVELADRGNRGSVRFVQREVMGRNAPVVASGITEVVGWWSTMLRAGAMRWDPNSVAGWVADVQLVPTHLRGNPIAVPRTPVGSYAPTFLTLGEF